MTSSSSSLRAWTLVVLGLALLASPSWAQTKSPFTIEDYFQVRTLRVDDWTKNGSWLACSLSVQADRLPADNARSGDPTYIAPSVAELVVIDTATGRQIRVLPKKEQFRGVSWSPDGKRLAFFLYKKPAFELVIWNRETQAIEKSTFKYAKPIASNSPLVWTADGTRLFLTVRMPDWEAKTADLFRNVSAVPVMLFDSEKPFLPWDEVSRRSRLVVPVVWDRTANTVTGLLEELPLLSSRLTKDGKTLVFERDVTEKTSYDIIGGTKNQLETIPLAGGKPQVVLKPAEQRSLVWTLDGNTLAYAEKGDVFVMSLEDKEPRSLTADKEPADKTDKAKDDKTPEKKKKQSFGVSRFSPDGTQLLCTSTRPQPDEDKDKPVRPANPPRQYWLLNVKTGEKQMVYELPEKEDARPNLQLVDWSPDGQALFFAYSAPDAYDRGLGRFDIATKTMAFLVRSSHLYSRWRMSENGSSFLYMESDGDRPEDLYVTASDRAKPARLTDLNPQLKDKALSPTELVSYRDADGKTLYGVLYYPANYEKGKAYPMVTEVYESYFENGFNAALNVLTSAGYAVLHPSVNFATGYPGEAWEKGALAAVNKVIEMGVADPDRLGIQGTSYGGYATVLLLTQTDRFKAAINNSGKVDMLSFYTQSPRLGVRNTHAPEKSQDRLGGTLWEYPERYLAHSAILQADRIKTPLLCITGDLDPNVEAVQSQEIFYALRRLGKKCVWLRYHGGAHGGPNSNEERRDMYERMIAWYDTYLKKDMK
jgi:dipeptidyl aminopeptidase/acylaminoacyl peptidase